MSAKPWPFNRRAPLRRLPKRDRAFELEQLAAFANVERVDAQPTPEEAHVVEPQGVSFAAELPRPGGEPIRTKASGCFWVTKKRTDTT